MFKKSIRKGLASASSLKVSFHSLLNAAALLLISFQDNGILLELLSQLKLRYSKVYLLEVDYI